MEVCQNEFPVLAVLLCGVVGHLGEEDSHMTFTLRLPKFKFRMRGCVKLYIGEHLVYSMSYVNIHPLVIILTAAWLTGKSPVLTMGFSTRTTISVGSTDAIAVAQLSAARSTCRMPS